MRKNLPHLNFHTHMRIQDRARNRQPLPEITRDHARVRGPRFATPSRGISGRRSAIGPGVMALQAVDVHVDDERLTALGWR